MHLYEQINHIDL